MQKSSCDIILNVFWEISIVGNMILPVHIMTIKFLNWRYYSTTTTNAICWGWTERFRDDIYLYRVQVSIYLVDAYNMKIQFF
jgi:hypothetical protein